MKRHGQKYVYVCLALRLFVHIFDFHVRGSDITCAIDSQQHGQAKEKGESWEMGSPSTKGMIATIFLCNFPHIRSHIRGSRHLDVV